MNNWQAALRENDIIVDDEYFKSLLEKPADERSPKEIAYIEAVVDVNIIFKLKSN